MLKDLLSELLMLGIGMCILFVIIAILNHVWGDRRNEDT